MRVIETIKRQERERGLKIGIKKGKIEGKREAATVKLLDFL